VKRYLVHPDHVVVGKYIRSLCECLQIVDLEEIFAGAAMDAQALAEAEITQAITAAIPTWAIEAGEFYAMVKDISLPAHQCLAMVIEAAVINSSVNIFSKIEGSGQVAAYGFTLKGSACQAAWIRKEAVSVTSRTFSAS
jgi:hypothetical protein